MRFEQCGLAHKVAGITVGCDGRSSMGRECTHCGWYAPEAERRKALPLKTGKNGLRYKDIKKPKVEERKIRRAVICTDEKGEERFFKTVRDGAKATGVNHSSIIKALYGAQQKAGGLKWRYVE